ncbi:hypothetical protein [Pantoea sp. DY-5]|uniref:hypothetical protein n=1 Tax=Pantoea sp. DY-5 TaxID=2871488 RepID=UPI001C941A87|nr:hypothetical protein [Pantoea sp. DY-5]MBY4841261.1 hypothetical protein [Pantoea sp. DY-5]
MKLYHIDKAKDYRRIMLDALEVVPRRFRNKIMQDMADIRDDGDFIADTFADHLHRDRLQFFYRLRSSRFFRHVTPHQKSMLRSIVDRLEEAYHYDTGQAFRFETAEEKQVSRKEWQVHMKKLGEIYQCQSEWSQKHPHLSDISYFLQCTPLGFFAVILIVLAVTYFVFGGRHPALSFWH